MDDLTGKTLGRYQVSALVGRGGMATVYKARDPGLNRTVALKLLHAHLSADPAFVARFRREARAVAALRHPNIVQVFDFDSAGGAYFMVMEFVDGPTLATWLRRLSKKHQRPTAEDVLRIFPPLCSAIDYANREGMVHRDIKPSNIMLNRRGDPVLTDYGIARVAGATSYTMPGTVVGSAQYMSPEQAQGQLADNRSDIYSLGVCLFETLTGHVPFDGETTATILAQHLTMPVPAARNLNPDLPPEAEAILSRALAKDPRERYQDAAEMARDLETALRPLVQPAPAPAGATVVEAAAAGATRVEKQVHTPVPPTGPPVTPPGTPVTAAGPPVTPVPPSYDPSTPPGGYPAAAPQTPATPAGGYPVTTPAGGYPVAGLPPGYPAATPPQGYPAASPQAQWPAGMQPGGWQGQPAGPGYGTPIYPQVAQQPAMPPVVATGPAPRRRRRWPLVLLIVVLLAAAGTAAALLLRSRGGTASSTTSSTTVASSSTTTGGPTTTAGGTATTLSADDAAMAARADALVQEGKIEEAVTIYQDLLKTQPESAAVLTQLGIAYAMMPNTKEEAEAQLVHATEADPGSALAWTFLGFVRYDMAWRAKATDYKSVEDPLNKAIELDPADARAHSFLGQAYAAQGRNDEALAEANKAVDMAPEDCFTVSSLGYVHAMRQEQTDAVPLYQKAISLQPNWAWLHLLLAEALQATEQYDAALASAQKALDLGQGYQARAYRRLGHIFWAKGDTSRAETNFKKSLELDNTDDFAQWGLGAVWYQKGDYQNALNHLKAAADLVPNNAGYQAWLGACYKELGMFAEARAALEKALQLDPQREDATSMLNELTAAGH